jgi:hypothetical protein
VINNIRARLPEYDMMVNGNNLTMTPKESSSQEYNETTTSAEWVDPYVKMDKKTNRYRKVAGYWRDVQKPVVSTGSIVGERKGSFNQLPPKEQIETLLKKNI